MTIFAYLRVSTDGQTTENQKLAIMDCGFTVDEWVSEDGVSGTTSAAHRKEFKDMLSRASSGDTVICTAIDRIGRNTIDVLQTVELLLEKNVRLRVIQFGGIDLTSSVGKFTLTVMAACAEMERNMIVERTKAGMARTASQGTKLGQPLKISPSVLADMVGMHAAGHNYTQIGDKHGFQRNTVGRNIEKWGDDLIGYSEEWKTRAAQYEKKAV